MFGEATLATAVASFFNSQNRIQVQGFSAPTISDKSDAPSIPNSIHHNTS
jgi:hypothetical protein